jgi:osmoprotectant transport system permease protein
VRTAAVQIIATATLAAYVGGGGLGRLVADGFGRADPAMTAAGGVLVAALALVVEVSLAGVQRAVTPGRRRPVRRRDADLVTPLA